MPIVPAIDDDIAFPSLLAVALQDEGHTVLNATDGETALYLLTEHPADALLVALLAEPEVVHTREGLLEHVWEQDSLADPRVVDSHVRRLRAELEEDPANPRHLPTVRGFGYRFVP